MDGGSLETDPSATYHVIEGIFRGVGTFTGNLMIGDISASDGAILSPGTTPGSIGTLNIVGCLWMGPTAWFVVELAAGGNDRVNVDKFPDGSGGSVSPSGTLDVRLLDNYDPPVGAVFTFLTWELSCSDDFIDFSLPAWGGKTFDKHRNNPGSQGSYTLEVINAP
jgi:hypothetical protein